MVERACQPVSLADNKSRPERVSAYVEYEFAKFLDSYRARIGVRSVSEALRRLAIIGAKSEGYKTDERVN